MAQLIIESDVKMGSTLQFYLQDSKLKFEIKEGDVNYRASISKESLELIMAYFNMVKEKIK